MSETSKLQAFLLALQTSPGVQRRYEKHPGAEMRRFDLSPSTIKAVLSGDVVELWRVVVGPSVQVGHIIVVEETRRRWKTKRS